jgi:hypothetical protein
VRSISWNWRDCGISSDRYTGLIVHRKIYGLNSYPTPNFVVKFLNFLLDVGPDRIEVAAVIKIPITGPKSHEY